MAEEETAKEKTGGGERIGDERNERKVDELKRQSNGKWRSETMMARGSGKTRISNPRDGGEEKSGGKGGDWERAGMEMIERESKEGGENQESRGRCRTVERSFAGKKETQDDGTGVEETAKKAPRLEGELRGEG